MCENKLNTEENRQPYDRALLAILGISAATGCILYVYSPHIRAHKERCYKTRPVSNMTDQPGRVMAVTVFAPTLVYKAWHYKDIHMGLFGAILWGWDMYWLLNKFPRCSSTF